MSHAEGGLRCAAALLHVCSPTALDGSLLPFAVSSRRERAPWADSFALDRHCPCSGSALRQLEELCPLACPQGRELRRVSVLREKTFFFGLISPALPLAGCRALSVPTAFTVARENLVTALDANRASYAKLAAAAGGGYRGGGAGRGVRPLGQLERELKTRCERGGAGCWLGVAGVLGGFWRLSGGPMHAHAACGSKIGRAAWTQQEAVRSKRCAAKGQGVRPTADSSCLPAGAAASARATACWPCCPLMPQPLPVPCPQVGAGAGRPSPQAGLGRFQRVPGGSTGG